MGNRFVAITIFLACIVAVSAAADPDPLQVALDKAKAGYAAEVDKSGKVLVEKFDERIKKAADGGNLDVVLRLRAEKRAFEEADAPPKSVLMKTAYTEYLGQVKVARQKLSEAYDATIKGYTKKLDTDRAEEVRGEFFAFKAGPTRGLASAPEVGREVEVSIAPGTAMRFCRIPAGKATLGSPPTEAGRKPDEDEHEFTTEDFWLGKYEVTQAEWTAVMGSNPSTFDGLKPNQARGVNTATFPAESVSYDDCLKFLAKLNARPEAVKGFVKTGRFVLPGEDEWEYACRGGKGNARPFYFDGELDGRQANYDAGKHGRPSVGRPMPVGSYAKAFPHPWGLCDMHGNVWEWCEAERAPPGVTRVIRGGCWGGVGDCRAASRNFPSPPTLKYLNLGFRVCFRPD